MTDSPQSEQDLLQALKVEGVTSVFSRLVEVGESVLAVGSNRKLANALGLDDAIDVVLAFFDRSDFNDRLTTLIQTSTSGASFVKQFHRSLVNNLLDKVRQSDGGYVTRRVRNVIDSSTSLVIDAVDVVRDLEHPETRQPDMESAKRFAQAFEFEPVLYRSATRRSPIIGNDDLLSLVEGIVGNGGPLALTDILGLTEDRVTFDTVSGASVDFFDPPAQETALVFDAVWLSDVFDELTDYQKETLAVIFLTNGEAATHLGISASSMTERRLKVGVHLARLGCGPDQLIALAKLTDNE